MLRYTLRGLSKLSHSLKPGLHYTLVAVRFYEIARLRTPNERFCVVKTAAIRYCVVRKNASFVYVVMATTDISLVNLQLGAQKRHFHACIHWDKFGAGSWIARLYWGLFCCAVSVSANVRKKYLGGTHSTAQGGLWREEHYCARPQDFRMTVEEFGDILQRVETLNRQTNDSPERPDIICRAFGGHAKVQVPNK